LKCAPVTLKSWPGLLITSVIDMFRCRLEKTCLWLLPDHVLRAMVVGSGWAGRRGAGRF
jgi:hypothetical protein